MVRRVKFGKVTVVVLITVLIWVWADLALDEEVSVSNATISVAKSTNPRLWVSFDDRQSVSIEQITLKGPASRISYVRTRLDEGSFDKEFFFDAAVHGMADPNQYTLDVLGFLKKSGKIRVLGLSVESCEPKVLSVTVTALVEKSLEVRCRDDEGNVVKTVSIDPPQVKMFVPESWEGERLVAWVTLTRREIEYARSSAIEETPFIRLADEVRDVARSVKITTAPEEDLLSDYIITTVRVGIAMSPYLQDKYKVVITNPDVVKSAITIRATQEARLRYESERYQVTLEIDDSDQAHTSSEPQRRALVYNFPEEYVRSGEIELKNPAVEAKFRLIPHIPAGGSPAGGP